MPIEIGVWRLQVEPQRLSFSALETENKREDIVARRRKYVSCGRTA